MPLVKLYLLLSNCNNNPSEKKNKINKPFSMTFGTTTSNALKVASRTIAPRAGLKTTTFPTVSSSSQYHTVQCFANEHSRGLWDSYSQSGSGGRTTRPTVVISSDNEVETVAGHVRV